jgi:hypothetical protein
VGFQDAATEPIDFPLAPVLAVPKVGIRISEHVCCCVLVWLAVADTLLVLLLGQDTTEVRNVCRILIFSLIWVDMFKVIVA